jgi:hypothetical protein
MGYVGMYKAATDKTIPLVTGCYGRGIKDEVIHNFLITECGKGYKCSNDDYDERYREHYAL